MHIVHIGKQLGKVVWIAPSLGKDKPICGIVFAQGCGCTWWVIQEDGGINFKCVP